MNEEKSTMIKAASLWRGTTTGGTEFFSGNWGGVRVTVRPADPPPAPQRIVGQPSAEKGVATLHLAEFEMRLRDGPARVPGNQWVEIAERGQQRLPVGNRLPRVDVVAATGVIQSVTDILTPVEDTLVSAKRLVERGHLTGVELSSQGQHVLPCSQPDVRGCRRTLLLLTLVPLRDVFA